jgi:ectoine hydroxylase-related dioxygenase (phytanoyl-CoA dioxygenase family)
MLPSRAARRVVNLRRLLCTSAAPGLSESERYLFDLNGFIVLRNVLSAAEVGKCNAVIDAEHDRFQERKTFMRNSQQNAFRGDQEDSGRLELGVFELEGCRAFNNLLAHPAVAPKLTNLVGEGYRLDHQPLVFLQRPGVEGFDLHGGNIAHSGAWNRELSYETRDGNLYCNLLAMSVQLTDTHAGEGGFCVIPGSHKANFKVPDAIQEYEAHQDIIVQPPLRAGDVVLFSEASTHGALPWLGEHERRVALYRFAPSTIAYGRGYLHEASSSSASDGPIGYPSRVTEDMTPEQKSVLQPPFSRRLDRVAIVDGHAVNPHPRQGSKKDFDRKIFGADYF